MIEVERYLSLKDVEPIRRSPGLIPLRREDLKGLVESPLLEACELLYDKNIRTLYTSANTNPHGMVTDRAILRIDFTTLSQDNQRIAKELGGIISKTNNPGNIEFCIPITSGTNSFKMIEAWSIEIANSFQQQEALWIPSIESLEEVLWLPLFSLENNSDDNPFGYFDEGSQMFFLSEEHYKKKKLQLQNRTN